MTMMSTEELLEVITSLKNRVDELEARQKREKIPLTYPVEPTFLHMVRFFPDEEIAVGAALMFISGLPVSQPIAAPNFSPSIKLKERQATIGCIYLDLLYNLACQTTLSRAQTNVINWSLTYSPEPSLKQLPGIEHPYVQLKVANIENDLAYIKLTGEDAVDPQLYEIGEEKLKQQLAMTARQYGRNNETD